MARRGSRGFNDNSDCWERRQKGLRDILPTHDSVLWHFYEKVISEEGEEMSTEQWKVNSLVPRKLILRLPEVALPACAEKAWTWPPGHTCASWAAALWRCRVAGRRSRSWAWLSSPPCPLVSGTPPPLPGPSRPLPDAWGPRTVGRLRLECPRDRFYAPAQQAKDGHCLFTPILYSACRFLACRICVLFLTRGKIKNHD